ncbi:MAG: hypothetical protein R3B48_20015 [Kofleriaceae bacterium]
MRSPLDHLTDHARAHLPPAQLAQVTPILARFAPELGRYAELIVGARGAPWGLMTRGEDARFTERVAATMSELGLPPDALAHHRELAAWFEHRRAFVKLEWHPGQAERAPNLAVYFRRRPAVEDVLARLGACGVAAPVVAELRALAGALEKPSVHFVAAACSRAQPLQHKLYFSQLVVPERLAALEDRLLRVFALARLPAAGARWLPAHRRAVEGARESTLYVSFNLTESALVPTLKLDYSDLRAAQVAAWADEADRPRVEAEAEEIARAMGGPRLSYVGVRFEDGAGAPRLKYYADRSTDEA